MHRLRGIDEIAHRIWIAACPVNPENEEMKTAPAKTAGAVVFSILKGKRFFSSFNPLTIKQFDHFALG